MSQLSDAAHFLRDAAREGTLSVAIPVRVKELKGHHLTLMPHDPDNQTAYVHRLNATGLLNQWWRIEGTIDDEGVYHVKKAFVESAHEDPDRVFRSSRRIERPEVKCLAHHDDWSVDFGVMDLSAGGVGLYATEHVKAEVGERLVLELTIDRELFALEAFIAHVAPDAKGTRLGVQFTPMPESEAGDFYEALNELAGETLVEAQSEASFLAQFGFALEHGNPALEAQWTVVGTADRLVFTGATAETLRDHARRLFVKTDSEMWVADVEIIGENTYDLRRVRPLQEIHERGAGYRVSPSMAAPATITRAGLGTITGLVSDLSRGGVGVVLVAPTEFETRERVEVEYEIPGIYKAKTHARVVYARFEPDGRQFIGLAFVGLTFAQTIEIDAAVSKLESREVMRNALFIGIAVFLVFVSIVLLGILIPD